MNRPSLAIASIAVAISMLLATPGPANAQPSASGKDPARSAASSAVAASTLAATTTAPRPIREVAGGNDEWCC